MRFKVTKDTNKSDVTGYFNSLVKKLGKASSTANLIRFFEKASLSISPSAFPVTSFNSADTLATLSKLKGHLEDLKEIGDGNEVTGTQSGVVAQESELKIVYKALEGIVGEAGKAGVDAPKESDLTLSQASIGGGANPKDVAKVLTEGAALGDAGPGATTIVSAVSGKEIF